MNIKSLAIILLGAFLPCFSFAESWSRERVVASVTRVVAPQRPVTDKVTLWMTIHKPSSLAGFQFLIATESTDRTKIRSDFPIGSLLVLELPNKTWKELEVQVEAHRSVEKSMDSGTDPAIISQSFLVPSVKFTELPSAPEVFHVNTEQAK